MSINFITQQFETTRTRPVGYQYPLGLTPFLLFLPTNLPIAYLLSDIIE